MENYEIKPKVDEVQEFIEIANDFGNPLHYSFSYQFLCLTCSHFRFWIMIHTKVLTLL
jgi:hypothetical protein